MTLPDAIQPLVDQIRAILGVPACQLTINLDDRGTVQTVEPRLVYRKAKEKA